MVPEHGGVVPRECQSSQGETVMTPDEADELGLPSEPSPDPEGEVRCLASGGEHGDHLLALARGDRRELLRKFDDCGVEIWIGSVAQLFCPIGYRLDQRPWRAAE